MPIVAPSWEPGKLPPMGELKPNDAPYTENTGAAYQMPYAPLPMQVDSRVPMHLDVRRGAVQGGTLAAETLQYFVSNRTERAGRVYTPRPASLPGGSFNNDVLYIGTKDKGDVYGG